MYPTARTHLLRTVTEIHQLFQGSSGRHHDSLRRALHPEQQLICFTAEGSCACSAPLCLCMLRTGHYIPATDTTVQSGQQVIADGAAVNIGIRCLAGACSSNYNRLLITNPSFFVAALTTTSTYCPSSHVPPSGAQGGQLAKMPPATIRNATNILMEVGSDSSQKL